MSTGLRILIILTTVLLVTVTTLWITRVTLLQHLFESQLELTLELDSLELDSLDLFHGSTMTLLGTGLTLSGDQFRINAREVAIGIRLEDLRGDGHYLTNLEASDGHIELLSVESDDGETHENKKNAEDPMDSRSI